MRAGDLCRGDDADRNRSVVPVCDGPTEDRMATNADLYAVHRYQRITVLARCTGITEQLPRTEGRDKLRGGCKVGRNSSTLAGQTDQNVVKSIS